MNHLAAFAAAALVAAIWQGAILAAVVALTLRLLPAVSAATRSLIWTVTFALLVALHLLPAVRRASGVAKMEAHPLHFAPILSIPVAAVWLALSLFRAAQFLLSAHRLHQINHRAVPIDSETLGAPLIASFSHAMSHAMSGPTADARPYSLCVSPDLDRPSVLGFFHPRILLPVGLLETLTPAELHQILLHETEHLRRSDDWTNLLQKLALVVFPLNPVLFWVERRLCLERELACDARVLSTGENLRKSYATTLTRLAEHSILRRGLNLALGILGHRPCPSELSTRVHRILTRPAKTLTRAQTRLATGIVLAGVVALSATLAHAPSLITFTPEASPEQATNLSATGLGPEAWAPKLVPARALANPAYRTVETVAHLPIATPRRIKRTHTPQRAFSAPRGINTAYRVAEFEAVPRSRLTLTVATGPQVQQFVVSAVAYVPAYAAVRTPDGWVIFQL